MHQVKEFIPYETTRSLVLGHDHMTIKAFDDSDLLGGDDFRFMKVAHFYGCKIGILSDLGTSGKTSYVDEWEKIGITTFAKLRDDKQKMCFIWNWTPVILAIWGK